MFLLFFISQKTRPAINAMTTTATPTPTPAFAPVLKPPGELLLDTDPAAPAAEAEADVEMDVVEPVVVPAPALVLDIELEDAVDEGMKSTIVLV